MGLLDIEVIIMNEKRFEPFQIVKKQLEIKKKECAYSTDELTHKRLEFISNMLNNERCFFELRKGVALEILSFLGFDDERIFELYDQLTDYELFKGNFEFTNLENAQNSTLK